MMLLLSVAYVYYVKYIQTKIRLDFEIQDVRNVASGNNYKVEEMQEVQKQRSKYSTLTENSYSV